MSNEGKYSEGRFYEDLFVVVLFSIVNTDFLLDVQTILQSILPKHIRLSLITKSFYLWNIVQHIIIIIMFQH